MANRFWVGGTDNWDATAGTKWALTSGGAGGQAVPTNSDDVFFDANSGGVTVTVSVNAVCHNLDQTGCAGTGFVLLWGTDISFSGSVILTADSLNVSGTGSLTFTGAGTNQTFTSNGNTGLEGPLIIDAVGGKLTLVDTFSIGSSSSGNVVLTNGILDISNRILDCWKFQSNNANTRELRFGSGTILLHGTGTIWDVTSSLTLTIGTGLIKLVNTSSGVKTFAGAGLTYNNIWNAANGATTVTGSNTFNDFKIDYSSGANTTKFTAGTATTISTLTCNPTLGATITSDIAAPHTLIFTNGVINVQNTTISFSNALGARAQAYISNGNVDAGNNTSWIFNFVVDPVLFVHSIM